MSKRVVIFAVGFTVLSIGISAGSVMLAMSLQKPSDKPASSTAEHDETNSDNHHSSSSETSTADTEDLTNQAEVAMDIKDYKYSKASIKIKKGTTVTWTNQDAMKHNVMQDHSESGKSHDAPTKEEVKPDVFASNLLAKGESYSFTFEEVGAHPYHCSPHPYMKGSVTVVE